MSEACAAAFRAAAAVDAYHDKHEDLFPAYSACSNLEEWKAADRMYPDAIDGVDPVRYAMTICARNQRKLGKSPICRTVASNATPSTTSESGLRVSGKTGLLGVPIPKGARLIEQEPGDPSAGRDPRERYAVSATAAEIAAFYDRELPRAGWAKDGTSTETALFYLKGRKMIGVLMSRDGGTFTLMGS